MKHFYLKSLTQADHLPKSGSLFLNLIDTGIWIPGFGFFRHWFYWLGLNAADFGCRKFWYRIIGIQSAFGI